MNFKTSSKNTNNKDGILNPKDFMRTRHPDMFSDSKIIRKSKLDKDSFGYHLDTLENRSQEKDFEEFARKLCEFEICPNLRPQTGSSAGGDRKVDSESIPVSSDIQMAYFEGVDSQNKEKIAIAVGTNKGWRKKVRDDVDKAIKTGHGYARIYFVSNRYIKDSLGANLEDELSKKYGIPIIILDKSWIIDRVVGSSKKEKIAIDELKMSTDLLEEKKMGVLDYGRNEEYEEVQSRIEDDVSSQRITLKTIDDTLRIAKIAAMLDKDRITIDGLFDRAIRYAKRYGTKGQHFTAIYQKAWSTYFWIEDTEAFLELYNEVEKAATQIDNIYVVERLLNLWMILSTISRTSNMVEKSVLEIKTKSLKDLLEDIKSNNFNASAVAQAKIMEIFINLVNHNNNIDLLKKDFIALNKLLDNIRGLIGVSFDTLFTFISELPTEFKKNNEFNTFSEKLSEVMSSRGGELAAAEIMLQRGEELIKMKRPYDAIVYLAKSLWRFHKDKSKEQLVRALFMLSHAYEEVGLLWAARGALLHAASYATSDFWIYDDVNRMQAICYKQLRLMELRLGRVGYALQWHSIYSGISAHLARSNDAQKEIFEDSMFFGTQLSLLTIKTHTEQLPLLEKLPDTLLNMDLDFAAFALLYRLGGEKMLPKNELFDTMQSQEIKDFFISMATQPSQDGIAKTPKYYNTEHIELESNILGATFLVRTSNNSPEIELAESILASLESFLSTSMNLKATANDSVIEINIKKNIENKEYISYSIDKSGKLKFSIECSDFNPHSISVKESKKISKILSEIVAHIVAHSIMFADAENDLEKLMKEQETWSRAFDFSFSFTVIGNVLGHEPKVSIDEWISEENIQYKYDDKESVSITTVVETKEPGNKNDIQTHSNMKVLSVVRQHLWDSAGWKGVLYSSHEDKLPELALLFENKNAATGIFEDWRSDFGDKDEHENIRLTIIRGISKKNPAWYRVSISARADEKTLVTGDLTTTVCRNHTMTPKTTENLDLFLETLKESQEYMLIPGTIDKSFNPTGLAPDLGIRKKELNVKWAWEISENDLDIAAILPNDDPVIPIGVKRDVMKVLKKKTKENAAFVKEKKVGRNDQCPCKSGKKYKRCCGR